MGCCLWPKPYRARRTANDGRRERRCEQQHAQQHGAAEGAHTRSRAARAARAAADRGRGVCKDRTVQPLLSVTEGDQVSYALALIFGRGGPERRGHLGREV